MREVVVLRNEEPPIERVREARSKPFLSYRECAYVQGRFATAEWHPSGTWLASLAAQASRYMGAYEHYLQWYCNALAV